MSDTNINIAELTDISKRESELKAQIEELTQSLKNAYYVGDNLEDKGVYEAIDSNKKSTDLLLIERKSFRELKEKILQATDNSKVAENFSNHKKRYEAQIQQLEAEKRELKFKLKNVNVNEIGEKVKSLNTEIASLKRQNEERVNHLLERDKKIKALEQEIEELRSTSKVSAEEHERRSKATAAGRAKAQQIRTNKANEQASLIISYTICGLSSDDIQEVFEDFYSKNINKTTIYHVLSVRKDSDRERILSLFKEYQSYFSCTEEELIAWFEKTRIKKLHLISREEFIKKYGVDNLTKPDKYVSGEYYPQPV